MGTPRAGVKPAIGSELSRRIEALRVLCICGVVIVHTAPPEAFGALFFAPWAKFLYVFFSCGFFRAAVPTLSIISGYLALRAWGHTPYRAMIATKCRTLLLPAIAWGALTAVPALILQWTGVLPPNTFELYGGGVLVWLDAVLGIDKGPINTPLYFLYDLFLCFAALPIFHAVLKRTALLGGLVLVVVLLIDPLDGTYLRLDIVLGFYAGGLIALRGLDPFRLDRYRLPCLAVFVAACALLAGYGTLLPPGQLETGLRPGINALRLIGPLAMWAVVSYLARAPLYARLAAFGKHAFFVYCFHSPPMRLLARAWFAIDAQFPPAAYLGYFLLAAPLTIALSLLAAGVLERTAGGLLRFLSGNRLGGGGGRPRATAAPTAASCATGRPCGSPGA